jgi:hypothetical protein
MDKFKNQLLSDLMQEHGAALAVAEPSKPQRSTRPAWVAAGAVALAGATFVTLSLTSDGSPAFAITKTPDGMVEVTIPEEAGIDPANKELERQGLPIRVVRGRSDCPPIPGPPGHSTGQLMGSRVLHPLSVEARWRVSLADVYPGETVLFIQSNWSESGVQSFLVTSIAAGVPVPECAYDVQADLPLRGSVAPPLTTPR